MEEKRINSVGETADTIGGGENLETPHKRRVRYKVHRQVCIFPLW